MERGEMKSLAVSSVWAKWSLVLAFAFANLSISGAVAQVASGPPTLNSFSPTSGPVGTVITIMGTNFTVENTVRFRSPQVSFAAGSPVKSDNGAKLEFHVTSCPSHALQCPGFFIPPGDYSVSVTNSNGTSNSAMFTITRP